MVKVFHIKNRKPRAEIPPEKLADNTIKRHLVVASQEYSEISAGIIRGTLDRDEAEVLLAPIKERYDKYKAEWMRRFWDYENNRPLEKKQRRKS